MRAKIEIIGDIARGRRLAPMVWREFRRASWGENPAVRAFRALRQGHPAVTVLSAIVAAAGWANARRGA